jgi:hypothetical protein
MTDEQMRLLDEARATVERTAHIGEPDQKGASGTFKRAHDDRIGRWRADMEEQERKFAAARQARQDKTDAERAAQASAEWESWVHAQIREGAKASAIAVGQALKQRFDEVGAALEKRDALIERLQVQAARAEAEICKLQARVLQNEIDAERTLPSVSSMRRAVN